MVVEIIHLDGGDTYAINGDVYYTALDADGILDVRIIDYTDCSDFVVVETFNVNFYTRDVIDIRLRKWVSFDRYELPFGILKAEDRWAFAHNKEHRRPYIGFSIDTDFMRHIKVEDLW